MIENMFFYGLITLFFIILVLSPSYNFSLLNAGIYLINKGVSIEDIKNDVVRTDVLFAKQGLYDSVLVQSNKGEITFQGKKYVLEDHFATFSGDLRVLKLNGHVQCGTDRPDMVTTGLLGGLPVVLDKDGDVLNIGMGCGLTLGALEKGKFKNIDTLEIDPVVVEAAREFNDIHDNALDDPRSNIIIDDARNHLLKNNKKYDVIVNEPSPPYSGSGNSNLVTREFFLLMKNNLKEDGIVVQWTGFIVQEKCQKPSFDIFYKTFSSVFPYTYVFFSKAKIPNTQPYFVEGNVGMIKNYDYPNPKWAFGEAIVVGSLKPIEIEKYFYSSNRITEYFEQIRIFNLREHYLYGSEDIVGFSDFVELHTDDKPILEFLTAKKLYFTLNRMRCEAQEGIQFKT